MSNTIRAGWIDVTTFLGPAVRDGSRRRVQLTLRDGHYQNLSMDEVADLAAVLGRILLEEVFASEHPMLDKVVDAVWDECHWTEEEETMSTPLELEAHIKAKIRAALDRELPFSAGPQKESNDGE